MGDARRPLETPALGVPDVEWSRAAAVQALNILGNKKWVSVAPLTVTALSPVYQIAATLSMVAKGTGRFRARWFGYVSNVDAGAHNLFGSVSHGASVLVADYVQFPLLVQPSGEGAVSTVAFVIDLPTAAAFTAPVGSTTPINLLVGADAASDIIFRTRATQFEVEEY